jgi:hypothetical protein
VSPVVIGRDGEGEANQGELVTPRDPCAPRGRAKETHSHHQAFTHPLRQPRTPPTRGPDPPGRPRRAARVKRWVWGVGGVVGNVSPIYGKRDRLSARDPCHVFALTGDGTRDHPPRYAADDVVDPVFCRVCAGTLFGTRNACQGD